MMSYVNSSRVEIILTQWGVFDKLSATELACAIAMAEDWISIINMKFRSAVSDTTLTYLATKKACVEATLGELNNYNPEAEYPPAVKQAIIEIDDIIKIKSESMASGISTMTINRGV